MVNMNKQSPYYKQVLLLIRLIPIINQEACFALKGGTAINLFVCARVFTPDPNYSRVSSRRKIVVDPSSSVLYNDQSSRICNFQRKPIMP